MDGNIKAALILIGIGFMSRLCQLCDRFESDSIPHALFVCRDGSERRLRLWSSDLLVSAPKGMYKSMPSMPNKKCTVFI